MDIKAYKSIIETMILSNNLVYGFVNGTGNAGFFVRCNDKRIIWNCVNNTVELPDLPSNHEGNRVTLPWQRPTANDLITQIKGRISDENKNVYYIPSCPEDEFQASTLSKHPVLPYELVLDLESLLRTVQNDISSRFSITSRVSDE